MFSDLDWVDGVVRVVQLFHARCVFGIAESTVPLPWRDFRNCCHKVWIPPQAEQNGSKEDFSLSTNIPSSALLWRFISTVAAAAISTVAAASGVTDHNFYPNKKNQKTHRFPHGWQPHLPNVDFRPNFLGLCNRSTGGKARSDKLQFEVSQSVSCSLARRCHRRHRLHPQCRRTLDR